MVNGRTLEEELRRIDDFFSELSTEEFEEMILDCGVGVIGSSEESMYTKAISKRYANVGGTKKCNKGENFETTVKETKAA